ncbi:MAG: restriction endonuclease subunit S, partial [Lachnospiraceae bacterium]|nr:restriction endonuclease subunit S [Lachnospiraceae bacterium]
MSEWKSVKLDDFISFNPKETLKKGTLAKKVAMDVLQPFCRDIPSYEVTEYNGGTKFRNGDTIMARITPCLENGKTSKVQILDSDEIGFGSTEYIVLRAIPNVSDENYVYYLTCSPVVREPAIKSMVGSSGRQHVQTDVIQNLEINVPDLETQQKIGGLLKSIDDKI